MTINKTKENDCLKIALEGRLDTLTAPKLDAEIQGALDGITSLVFDFEKLAYISSAGLRIIYRCRGTLLHFICRTPCSAFGPEGHEQAGHDGHQERRSGNPRDFRCDRLQRYLDARINCVKHI